MTKLPRSGTLDEFLAQVVSDYNRERESVSAVLERELGKLNRLFLPLAVILAAAIITALVMKYVIVAIALGVVGGAGLLIGYFWKRSDIDAPAEKLREQLRQEVFPAIFPQVQGFSFEANTNGLASQIPEAIRPDYQNGNWGDFIEGKWKGKKFAINEMHLTSQVSSGSGKSRTTRTVTRFKGVVLQMQLSKPAPDTLIVRNNRMEITQWFSKTTGFGLQVPLIEVGNAEFEQRNDIHCENSDYVFSIFSSAGIEKYLEIQRAFSSGEFQFVAEGKTVTMLIEHNRNFFEVPPINKPFNIETDVPRLRGELGGFLDLIDSMEELLLGKAGAKE